MILNLLHSDTEVNTLFAFILLPTAIDTMLHLNTILRFIPTTILTYSAIYRIIYTYVLGIIVYRSGERGRT